MPRLAGGVPRPGESAGLPAGGRDGRESGVLEGVSAAGSSPGSVGWSAVSAAGVDSTGAAVVETAASWAGSPEQPIPRTTRMGRHRSRRITGSVAGEVVREGSHYCARCPAIVQIDSVPGITFTTGQPPRLTAKSCKTPDFSRISIDLATSTVQARGVSSRQPSRQLHVGSGLPSFRKRGADAGGRWSITRTGVFRVCRQPEYVGAVSK